MTSARWPTLDIGGLDQRLPGGERGHRQVAAKLPQAWVVQVPGSTHNALGFSDCPIGIRNAWVQDPTAPPSDTICLRKLRVSFAAAP